MFKRICMMVLAGLAMGFLAGCGGGSGGSQLSPVSTSAKISMAVTTSSTGASTTHISYGDPVSISAVVTDKNGKAAPGVIVTFSIDETAAATLSQTKVLTDSSGIATVRVSANKIGTDTAIVVSASTTISSTSTTGTSTTATASASANLSVGQTTSGTAQGTPALLQYVSATPTRLVIKGASAGSGTLSETSTVSFKVLDSSGAPVTGASVIFDVTSRNGGILTNGSGSAYTATSDSGGIAKVTIQSGTLPESFLVYGTLPASASPATKYYSNDQLAISSSFPDQSHFSLGWEAGSGCLKTGTTLTYPCTLIVNVGDFLGHPAPDGTVVTFVTSQKGLVVGDTLTAASGVCLTSAGQCKVKVWGDDAYTTGVNNEVVAYARGLNASTTLPITVNTYSAMSLISTRTVIDLPDSKDYVRDVIRW